MSNTSFEEQLKQMDFFQSHPFLKPFIGENYTENEAGIRMLLVGESHYVENPLPQITRESLLNDWWSENPPAHQRYKLVYHPRHNTQFYVRGFGALLFPFQRTLQSLQRLFSSWEIPKHGRDPQSL